MNADGDVWHDDGDGASLVAIFDHCMDEAARQMAMATDAVKRPEYPAGSPSTAREKLELVTNALAALETALNLDTARGQEQASSSANTLGIGE